MSGENWVILGEVLVFTGCIGAIILDGSGLLSRFRRRRR